MEYHNSLTELIKLSNQNEVYEDHSLSIIIKMSNIKMNNLTNRPVCWIKMSDQNKVTTAMRDA